METDLFDRIHPNEVLIASFPYKCVPTVAALMVNHTFTRLNHVLSAEDKPTVGYLNVFKYPWQASGEHYFAHMGEQARRRILDNVELSGRLDGPGDREQAEPARGEGPRRRRDR
jgi:hypothetical protein